jgi:hypothetical protein
MGLFERIKRLAQLDAPQTAEPSRELGDLIEPGSSPEAFGTPAEGSADGAAGLEQLAGLRASGLIDADTFELIETTMTNATAELDRLHASGAMSDEIYAQAMASVPGATSGSGLSVDAAELDLLQRGESAPATILALPGPIEEASAPLLITLEVHPAAGSAYEVDCPIAAVHPGGELKVGNFLSVKVDPDDPRHVAIDWSTFGS